MTIRYLSAGLVGATITAALIWVMHFLIAVSEGAIVDTVDHPPFELGRTIIEKPVVTRTIRTVLPAPPPVPPSFTAPSDPDPNALTVPIRLMVEKPPGPNFGGNSLRYADSALINIINAQPEYPMNAIARGLGGYVIVQFDVTELGTVENVVVLETSNSVFNKAAIKAAYRSRYKPKTVDGVPQTTKSLRKLFRFEMKT